MGLIIAAMCRTGYKFMTFAILVQCSTNKIVLVNIGLLSSLGGDHFGEIVQLVEHWTGTKELVGSNPVPAVPAYEIVFFKNCFSCVLR